MKKQITIFLLSLMSSAVMAQTNDSIAEPERQVAPQVVVNNSGEVSFNMLDSIRAHATAIYASKVLYANGFKLAYGKEVEQKGWRKYRLHEVAFSNSATYDENRNAWKVRRNQPFAYIRLVYDGENKRLCHYQVKFATRKGFSTMHKEAVANGYRYKSKKRDTIDKGMESTYYNDKTDTYMIFGEYEDGQMMVDMWQGGERLGR